MSELKPCPFCGESVELDYSELPNRKHWFITCECCGMMYQSSISQRKYVKVDWNTRPIEDALRVQLAARDALIERLVEVGNDIVEEAQVQEPDVQELRDNWRVLISEWKAMKGGE